eukprot:7343365-Pyramimonas_sp.AAC.2
MRGATRCSKASTTRRERRWGPRKGVRQAAGPYEACLQCSDLLGSLPKRRFSGGADTCRAPAHVQPRD